jgi:hypothetical protein
LSISLTRSGSRTRTTTRAARASAGVLALGLLVAGCGKEPVSIPTLRLSAADQAVCQRVANALPDEVADQSRRKTQPAAALGGAWGDPAIVAQCGVPVPAGFDRTSPCQTANGVGWYVPEAQFGDDDADIVISTAGYRPIVQVTIPATYRPEGLAAAMAQLAPVVRDYTKLVKPCH